MCPFIFEARPCAWDLCAECSRDFFPETASIFPCVYTLPKQCLGLKVVLLIVPGIAPATGTLSRMAWGVLAIIATSREPTSQKPCLVPRSSLWIVPGIAPRIAPGILPGTARDCWRTPMCPFLVKARSCSWDFSAECSRHFFPGSAPRFPCVYTLPKQCLGLRVVLLIVPGIAPATEKLPGMAWGVLAIIETSRGPTSQKPCLAPRSSLWIVPGSAPRIAPKIRPGMAQGVLVVLPHLDEVMPCSWDFSAGCSRYCPGGSSWDSAWNGPGSACVLPSARTSPKKCLVRENYVQISIDPGIAPLVALGLLPGTPQGVPASSQVSAPRRSNALI